MGTFYRSFVIVSLLINLCCISIFWKNGFSSFSMLFWLKIASLGITYHFINSYKSKEYYYYRNLGISKLGLWVVTLFFDIVLYLFLIILVNHYR
ncbi:MAG: hypothetical protein KGO92_03365 [Bacteroidota bacterium]|nr:hypothetical protein [Bacteroidota bacterium]